MDPPLWWSFSTALLMSGLTGLFVLSASWYSQEDAAKYDFRTVITPQTSETSRAQSSNFSSKEFQALAWPR